MHLRGEPERAWLVVLFLGSVVENGGFWIFEIELKCGGVLDAPNEMIGLSVFFFVGSSGLPFTDPIG